MSGGAQSKCSINVSCHHNCLRGDHSCIPEGEKRLVPKFMTDIVAGREVRGQNKGSGNEKEGQASVHVPKNLGEKCHHTVPGDTASPLSTLDPLGCSMEVPAGTWVLGDGGGGPHLNAQIHFGASRALTGFENLAPCGW